MATQKTAAITTATTTVVASNNGLLKYVNILGGTLGAITVYDGLTAGGTSILPTFTPTGPMAIPVFAEFATGLTIVTAAATILQVSYQ